MLKLTVLEYFADMDLVHVHCEQQICPDLDLPEALTKHLSSTKVLQNRPNRLFYVVPPFGIVMPINDIISFKVLFEWLKKNVHQIYAVIMNSTTPDLKKVVKLYVNKMPTIDVDQAKHFKRTVAKPFSHRPVKPEPDLLKNRSYSHHSNRSQADKSGSVLSNFSSGSNKRQDVKNNQLQQ
ncbi:uncharacterized protein LOC112692431 [Sipha flava]|uniref:Uncharacterized protein LOC112692431 n=1 Tax=Sipha flava TaxID=143950 RepID=A0A8B8GIQ0_9HEMI|nr:uncharacterized protein LOC112692431 [Sipha flava]